MHTGPNLKISKLMKGKLSKRLGKKSVPVASRLNGIRQIETPDPTLKAPPANFYTVVVVSHATMDIGRIRGRLLDYRCDDCSCRLSVDTTKQQIAIDKPERQGRPLRWICKECSMRYAKE